MSLQAHFMLMANYNQWMNARLYQAAAHLSAEQLRADRGAFFGSILGTLNHLIVGDIIWLKRFAHQPGHQAVLAPVVEMPMPASLDQVLFTDFALLSSRRRWLDDVICTWVGMLTDDDLALTLDYANTRGVVFRRKFSALLQHFFNHQTHHRGQVTTLLSQAGQDVGSTDLLALIADESDGV